MNNLRYAIALIGALSLLLGLGLGQIYYQYQRIEQLEFNRFRQSSSDIRLFLEQGRPHHHEIDLNRVWEQAARNERLQELMQRYNTETGHWESTLRFSVRE